jgi:hypothetical protein
MPRSFVAITSSKLLQVKCVNCDPTRYRRIVNRRMTFRTVTVRGQCRWCKVFCTWFTPWHL